MAQFGLKTSIAILNVILPLGISFYTFQSISYVTDVYRRIIAPEKSAVTYFAFICFFPQMVAGPIERAKHMLPQFKKIKVWNQNYFESGLNLIIYGLFKKAVIADNLSKIVDPIHANVAGQSCIMLWLGIFAFAFQIYADFSGYTDIARGCARLFGFNLTRNFYFPYFSTSFKQFWQRWHISLSRWFRDYVYIPLGGNRYSGLKRDKNLLSTFLLSGLWHGANLTFVAWGFLHGTSLIVEKRIPLLKIPNAMRGMFVFLIVSLLFTLFRSPTLTHYLHYLSLAFSVSNGSSGLSVSNLQSGVFFLLPCFFFLFVEINKYRLQSLKSTMNNYLYNIAACVFLLLFAVYENAPQFIYFQF